MKKHTIESKFKKLLNEIECFGDCKQLITHAIEFDFGNKWAQAVGQSLYYSYLTKKKAGIYFIIERQRDMGYLQRLKGVIKSGGLNIDVWVIKPDGQVDQINFEE